MQTLQTAVRPASGGVSRDGRSMLTRGLAILSVFRTGDTELTLAELSRRAGLPKPTAHRLVAELVERGVLERGVRGVRLGQQLFALGSRVPRQRLLREAAAPVLERLHEATGGAVYLSVLVGPDVIHLERVGAYRRGPAHWPGTGADRVCDIVAGRVLHAHREVGPVRQPAGSGASPSAETPAAVAERGYALAYDGRGTVGVSVPVRAAEADLIGALSVVVQRPDPRAFIAQLRTAADAVARRILVIPELQDQP